MATNLYETLEVSKDATPEQIRKAYKKKALQTHPDRLPQGTSPEERRASEELFRQVNHAYEVLTDPQNRRVYDLHGVWPPPEPESVPLPRSSSGHRPYSQRPYQSGAFFTDSAFEDQGPFFAFTDPFSLFDAVFGFGDARPHYGRRHNYERPWFASQLSRMMHDDIDDPFGFSSGLMGFPALDTPPFPSGSRGQWKSERFISSTVHGVTTTVHERRDWEGNEHVTRTYSDGREIRTINGVEQPPARGYLPPSNQYPANPPPPYPGHAPGGYDNPRESVSKDYSHRRDRTYSETQPVIPEPYTTEGPDRDHGNSHHRRRWWSGRR
ncbi:putative dnaJ molecular chaperone homology domain [Lyophyllum shimeji]|uniref:DnaJ molecular chaperone homology domain n=1 Tax=Lyophyllum shimeji TaxID=47721 RepID=A0A9P3PUZ3_LYOSH|nr:putative dnaJ molecular chaperone homology domain [Lyophyllum shimeji]